MNSVLMERGYTNTETHTQRTPCEHEDRNEGEPS